MGENFTAALRPHSAQFGGKKYILQQKEIHRSGQNLTPGRAHVHKNMGCMNNNDVTADSIS